VEPRTRPGADRRPRRGGRPSAAASNRAGVRGVATARQLPGHGAARSRSQPLAALPAPRREHRSSGSGLHPLPEAVLLRPLPLVGLIGPLHRSTPVPFQSLSNIFDTGGLKRRFDRRSVEGDRWIQRLDTTGARG
jgi:hypothetical protein